MAAQGANADPDNSQHACNTTDKPSAHRAILDIVDIALALASAGTGGSLCDAAAVSHLVGNATVVREMSKRKDLTLWAQRGLQGPLRFVWASLRKMENMASRVWWGPSRDFKAFLDWFRHVQAIELILGALLLLGGIGGAAYGFELNDPGLASRIGNAVDPEASPELEPFWLGAASFLAGLLCLTAHRNILTQIVIRLITGGLLAAFAVASYAASCSGRASVLCEVVHQSPPWALLSGIASLPVILYGLRLAHEAQRVKDEREQCAMLTNAINIAASRANDLNSRQAALASIISIVVAEERKRWPSRQIQQQLQESLPALIGNRIEPEVAQLTFNIILQIPIKSRGTVRLQGVCIAGVELRDLELTGFTFDSGELVEAKFIRCRIMNCSFTDANLRGFRMPGTRYCTKSVHWPPGFDAVAAGGIELPVSAPLALPQVACLTCGDCGSRLEYVEMWFSQYGFWCHACKSTRHFSWRNEEFVAERKTSLWENLRVLSWVGGAALGAARLLEMGTFNVLISAVSILLGVSVLAEQVLRYDPASHRPERPSAAGFVLEGLALFVCGSVLCASTIPAGPAIGIILVLEVVLIFAYHIVLHQLGLRDSEITDLISRQE